MATLPPRPVRRLIVTPLVLLLALVVVILAPVLTLTALIADLAAGTRWRTTRLTVLGVAFAALEAVGIVAMFVLWLVGGFGLWIRAGWMRRVHYGFLKRWLNVASAVLQVCLGLQVDPELQPPRPGAVLVFSRHAGPGDSLILTREIMTRFDRHPRIICKRDLQWAPFVDMIGSRIPTHFVDPNPTDGDRQVRAIADLASGIGERGALILFPEGENFTRKRRRKAIASLLRRGHDDHARMAEEMKHLIPPRPGGAIAAMDAAPHADVVFVAHTGTEHLMSLGDVWRAIPLRDAMRGRYWRIPAHERPDEHDEKVAWLFEWWAEIDRWIEAERSPT